MALKVALKFLKNFKILKKLSLKNAIFKHFWGFFACFYAILRYRDNRVSPAIGSRPQYIVGGFSFCFEPNNFLNFPPNDTKPPKKHIPAKFLRFSMTFIILA